MNVETLSRGESCDIDFSWDAETVCQYLRATPSCNGFGVINYAQFHFCTLNGNPWIALPLAVLALFLLLALLASTASQFLVPPLTQFAKRLGLSPAVAGVTLLAVSNSAPEFATLMAASQADEIGLMQNAVLGGVLCVLGLVFSAVTLGATSQVTLVPRLFYRDLCVVAIGVVGLVALALVGSIRWWQPLLLVLLWVLYVVSVVLTGRREQPWQQMNESHWFRHDRFLSLEDDGAAAVNGGVSEDWEGETPGEMEEAEEAVLTGLQLPSSASFLQTAFLVALWPFSVLRWLTIPTADMHWNKTRRILTSLTPVFLPSLMISTFFGASVLVRTVGGLPVWTLLSVVGGLVGAATFCATDSWTTPRWHLLLLLVAFVACATWLQLFADELVGLLRAAAFILDVPASVMGATLLAWGNSLSDLVTNLALTSQGNATLAMTGCFGAPAFTMLFGVGVALFVRSLQRPVVIHNDVLTYTAWSFLAVMLLVFALLVPAQRFQPRKTFALALVCLYLVFFLLQVAHSIWSVDDDFSVHGR